VPVPELAASTVARDADESAASEDDADVVDASVAESVALSDADESTPSEGAAAAAESLVWPDCSATASAPRGTNARTVTATAIARIATIRRMPPREGD
jgi:hypothetical protein